MKCVNWDDKNYDCKTCGEAVRTLSSDAVLGEVGELLDVIYQIRATDMRATEFTYDNVWSMMDRILEKADKVRANCA